MHISLDPVIAHRGASLMAPENTLAAFQRASELGARWVEFDVQMSADKIPVIIHDETLERTTDGSGFVIDYGLNHLKSLDAGSWFSDTYKNENIPSLAEVIPFLHKFHLNANVEIKPHLGTEVKSTHIICEYIIKNWPKNKLLPLISSFDITVLRIVKKFYPTFPLGLLLNRWRSDALYLLEELNCISIHLHHSLINQTRLAQLKALGMKILSYTVNDPQQALMLWKQGVDAVFTDNPLLLLALWTRWHASIVSSRLEKAE